MVRDLMAQPFVPPCQESRINAEECPRSGGYETSTRTKNIVLAACILASSMAFIDGSALTVALPALSEEFGGNLSVVQWILNGYVLALAALTMVGGALADVYGRARILAVGCVGFGVASAACALATEAEYLVGSRVLQGCFAAIVTPASLALLGETFPKDERAKAIGVWAGASALTTAGGPIIGGWLTESFSWRAIFWINIPIAFLAITLLAASAKPAVRNPKKFDLAGALLLALSLALLAFGLSNLAPHEGLDIQAQGRNDGSMVMAGLATSIIFLIIFIIWERRSPYPMTPGYVFRSIPFSGLNLATLFVYAGLSIMFFLLPFKLVDTMSMSPTQAGLAFLPFTLSVGLLSRFFGNLSGRIGERPLLLAGPLIAATSFALFAISPGSSVWTSVIIPMTLSGLGFAVIVAPLTSSVMANVKESDEGLASGVNNTASRIAQMLGIALAAIFAVRNGGFEAGLWLAASLCVVGALIILVSLPARGRSDADKPELVNARES